MRTLHFVAALDDTIAVAICLEHDIVTQAESMAKIRDASRELVEATIIGDRDYGVDTWSRKPPPPEAIAEIRAMPGAEEFEIEIE